MSNANTTWSNWIVVGALIGCGYGPHVPPRSQTARIVRRRVALLGSPYAVPADDHLVTRSALLIAHRVL